MKRLGRASPNQVFSMDATSRIIIFVEQLHENKHSFKNDILLIIARIAVEVFD